jgi:hypothetical protein
MVTKRYVLPKNVKLLVFFKIVDIENQLFHKEANVWSLQVTWTAFTSMYEIKSVTIYDSFNEIVA